MEYKNLLKHVYRTAPIGLCLFDAELRFQHINEWLASINGLSVEAHLGRKISEVIPDVSASVETILRHVMETGEPVLDGVVEADTPGSAGQTRVFQHSYHVVESDEGVVVGVSCIVQDITDRRRVEAALAEANDQLEERVRARTEELAQSESRQRHLQESTRAVPWEADAASLQFTYVGPQADELLGYPRAQWLEHDFWPSHILPEDREFATNHCLQSMKSKADFDFEYRMVAADGRTVWIHDIVHVEYEASQPKIFRGFMIDITERRQAEEELRVSAARLQLATDATRIGHWDWDIPADEVYFSPEWKRQIGYQDHELPNRFEEWKSRLHPDDVQKSLKAVEDYVSGCHADFAIEFRLRHKDGSYRWIYSRGEKHDDDTGTAHRLFGCHIDITERKNAEELLTLSEARFRMLYEHAPVMIDAFDDDGRCVMFNKECERVLGWTAAEVFSHKNPLALFYPDPQVQEQVIETVTSAPEMVFRKWKPRRKDGAETLCLWANFKLPDGLVINLGYDISEQEHAQEELRRNRDAMRVLARRLISAHEDERRRMARELHDDLSQRLASMALDATVLARDSQPDSEQYGHGLQQLCDRIQELSADIQQLSHRLHPSILDELGLCDAIESECAAFRNRTGILVQFTRATNSVSVEKDIELALYRILQECLRNIDKHARATSAQVTLRQDDQAMLLTVEDSGIGFDPDVSGGKSGLGMVSIHERVQLLGGIVTIESEIAHGTIVSIQIPMQGKKS